MEEQVLKLQERLENAKKVFREMKSQMNEQEALISDLKLQIDKEKENTENVKKQMSSFINTIKESIDELTELIEG